MDGTFTMLFSGVVGVGAAIFVLRDGEMSGAGVGGGLFRGQVTANPTTGALRVVFQHFVPAGLLLVQGTGPYDVSLTVDAEADFPPDFGDGEPVRLKIGEGLVTVMIKRISNDFAHFARGAVLTPLYPPAVA